MQNWVFSHKKIEYRVMNIECRSIFCFGICFYSSIRKARVELIEARALTQRHRGHGVAQRYKRKSEFGEFFEHAGLAIL